jgi:hypothetical protein
MTRAPSAAKSVAIARPIPELAPVTIAVLPSKVIRDATAILQCVREPQCGEIGAWATPDTRRRERSGGARDEPLESSQASSQSRDRLPRRIQRRRKIDAVAAKHGKRTRQ